MAQRVTAFQSADGRIHMDEKEADFADFSLAIRQDVSDFLKQRKLVDEGEQFERLLCDWELWRVGGYQGWLQRCEQQQAEFAVEDEQLLLVESAPGLAAVKPTTTRPPRRSADNKDKVHRKHVAVVGLDGPLHNVIQNEFSECFQLTLFDRDCIARLNALKGCHKVFAMTNYVSHKVIDGLRAIGQEPYRVSGGISTLKNALTEFYAA